eukprot:84232-Chlamydomonas_euryale.AAC.1
MSRKKALNSLGLLGGRMDETLLDIACMTARKRRNAVVQHVHSKCRAVLGDALMRCGNVGHIHLTGHTAHAGMRVHGRAC